MSYTDQQVAYSHHIAQGAPMPHGQQQQQHQYHQQQQQQQPYHHQQQQQHIVPGNSVVADVAGNFEGLQYRIDHRDSNSMLQVTLHPGYELKGKSGAMVTMQPTVQIKGKFKFSFKKMLGGGDMASSIFTGPGDVILAPDVWGDIVAIPIQPNVPWKVGKGGFLASTTGVIHDTKSQGAGKGFFSGEGFFVGHISGQGILFVQSIGAIIKKTLAPQEELIVDNGHLVAWSATYKMERIGTSDGKMMSGMHTGEGLVCRFTGPGEIYIQTRNPASIGAWIAAQVPPS